MSVSDSFNLSITRSISTVEGVSKYTITLDSSVIANSSSDAIRLDQNIFVKKTADSSFQRVANLSDLGLLKSDLSSALEVSAEEYRDSALVVHFSDSDTAVGAIPIIRDRVNSLINSVITSAEEFVGTSTYPDSYSFPLPDTESSVVDKYSTEYINAVASRVSSEASQVENQSNLDALTAKNNILKTYKNFICSQKTEFELLVALLTSFKTSYYSESAPYSLDLAISSLQSAIAANNDNTVGGFLQSAVAANNDNTVGGFLQSAIAANNDNTAGGFLDIVLTSLNKIAGSKWSNDLESIWSKATEINNTLSTECAGRTSEYSILESAEISALSDLKNSKQEKDDALVAEANALSNLRVFCPDLDPLTLQS